MRLAFAGTPEFAAVALAAILDSGHPVDLVLTKPDRPQGRGLRPLASAVKTLAQARGLAIAEPASLRGAEVQSSLIERRVDLLVVAAYGLLLPAAILSWPRHGCLNIHGSLLPRWRGAAPIQRALLAGDRETGITLMRMDEGLDTGPIVAAYPVAIERTDTAGSLHDKLAAEGGRVIAAAIDELERTGGLNARAQPSDAATYATKITRSEACIDWRVPAVLIERAVRAFDPSPGAYTTLDGVVVKIWNADVAQGRLGAPGSVVAADARGIVVACGEGALIVHALQRAGGRRLPADQFLAGHSLHPGQTLGVLPDRETPRPPARHGPLVGR